MYIVLALSMITWLIRAQHFDVISIIKYIQTFLSTHLKEPKSVKNQSVSLDKSSFTQCHKLCLKACRPFRLFVISLEWIITNLYPKFVDPLTKTLSFSHPLCLIIPFFACLIITFALSAPSEHTSPISESLEMLAFYSYRSDFLPQIYFRSKNFRNRLNKSINQPTNQP